MLVTWLFFCLCQWDIVWEQPDGNIPGTVSLSQQPGLLCEHQLSPQWNHKTWYPSGKKKKCPSLHSTSGAQEGFYIGHAKKSATSSCSWVFSHVCVVISILVFYRLILVSAYVKDKSKAAFRLWCSAYYVWASHTVWPGLSHHLYKPTLRPLWNDPLWNELH